MKQPLNHEKDGADTSALRERMVDEQIRDRGIADEHVLKAMRRVPRHAFVPSQMQEMAYSDGPLPIGNSQTISQPYIVALMTEALGLKPGQKVLEVGTGSGYQAAILAEMGLDVYTIEFLPDLSEKAREILTQLGYEDIHYRCGDGHAGWPEEAPFDGIIVTAAPSRLPEPLGEQLKTGGRLVIPIGNWGQDLYVYTRNEDGSLSGEVICAVRFVPLVKD